MSLKSSPYRNPQEQPSHEELIIKSYQKYIYEYLSTLTRFYFELLYLKYENSDMQQKIQQYYRQHKQQFLNQDRMDKEIYHYQSKIDNYSVLLYDQNQEIINLRKELRIERENNEKYLEELRETQRRESENLSRVNSGLESQMRKVNAAYDYYKQELEQLQSSINNRTKYTEGFYIDKVNKLQEQITNYAIEIRYLDEYNRALYVQVNYGRDLLERYAIAFRDSKNMLKHYIADLMRYIEELSTSQYKSCDGPMLIHYEEQSYMISLDALDANERINILASRLKAAQERCTQTELQCYQLISERDAHTSYIYELYNNLRLMQERIDILSRISDTEGKVDVNSRLMSLEAENTALRKYLFYEKQLLAAKTYECANASKENDELKGQLKNGSFQYLFDENQQLRRRIQELRVKLKNQKEDFAYSYIELGMVTLGRRQYNQAQGDQSPSKQHTSPYNKAHAQLQRYLYSIYERKKRMAAFPRRAMTPTQIQRDLNLYRSKINKDITKGSLMKCGKDLGPVQTAQ